MNFLHYIILHVCCAVPPAPASALSTTSPYPPRTAPRPTDQRSGELKDPALTAFLATPNDEADIDFALVPPDPAPGTCPHCQRSLHDEDTTLASLLAA